MTHRLFPGASTTCLLLLLDNLTSIISSTFPNPCYPAFDLSHPTFPIMIALTLTTPLIPSSHYVMLPLLTTIILTLPQVILPFSTLVTLSSTPVTPFFFYCP